MNAKSDDETSLVRADRQIVRILNQVAARNDMTQYQAINRALEEWSERNIDPLNGSGSDPDDADLL